MKRRLLNAATSLSLLLAAGVAVLCYRPGSNDLVWGSIDSDRRTYRASFMIFWRGRFAVGIFRFKPEDSIMLTSHDEYGPVLPVGFVWRNYPWWHQVPAAEHFGYRDLAGKSMRHRVLVLPAWMIVLVLLLPGAWFLKQLRNRFRRNRWNKIRHCLTCGYDMRATPERCPECGAVAMIEGKA